MWSGRINYFICIKRIKWVNCRQIVKIYNIYCHNWLSIFGGKRKTNVVVRFIYAINIIGIVLLIISQYTGWFYSFDSEYEIYKLG